MFFVPRTDCQLHGERLWVPLLARTQELELLVVRVRAAVATTELPPDRVVLVSGS
jgi:hypothetical protein